MKAAIILLVLAFGQFAIGAEYVTCGCESLHTTKARTAAHHVHRPAAGASAKTIIIVAPEPPHWGRRIVRAIAFPFRAIGQGVYYVVQGPRMLAEIIAFGNTGESFQKDTAEG